MPQEWRKYKNMRQGDIPVASVPCSCGGFVPFLLEGHVCAFGFKVVKGRDKKEESGRKTEEE